ncbi:MAG: hypothetical protein J1E82_03900 [Muribaculaceae bacterium]|nr:hypothetical protein [Muribaculaceae bacterium]
MLVLPVMNSCRDESFYLDDEVERQDNLPVELEINLPVATRGVNPKQSFENGEFIHIQGKFYMDDDSEEYRYGAFQYIEGKWEQYLPEGTTTYRKFTWPNNCVTAEFLAYYVVGTDALLVPTDNPEYNPVTNLSNVVGKNGNPDTDPLVARSNGTVKYGHTIVLNFLHACSYLIVEDMPPGIATNFWFTQQQDNGDVSPTFYNAFRLSLTTENKLKFEFVQDPDPLSSNEVYVAGASQSIITDGVEKASFGVFLAPGRYDNFVVGYPGTDRMNTYMRYKKIINEPANPGDGDDGNGDSGDPGTGGSGNGGDDNTGNDSGGITDENGNPYNDLEENGIYRFNLAKSAGVTILTPPPGEVWDDNENPIYPVDAEEFLYKVCNPEEYVIDYEGGKVKILEVVGNGTRLLQNVNFQWAKYDVFKPKENLHPLTWFIPDLPRGNLFDGNHHWIWNLGSPLFHTVNGNIKDLGITNADMSFVTRVNYKPDGYVPKDELDYFEMSRRGALCNYLQQGTLQNIRIRAKLPDWYENDIDPSEKGKYYNAVFNLNAYVYAADSQESHNIGCLVGSNLNGTINTINITCNMNLTVANYPETPRVPSLNIGGIVGQSVSTLTNVGTENSPKITITNICNYSNAAYYIGGITGNHTGGTISEVMLPNIVIQSARSVGFNSYIGGAVGALSNVDVGGELLNCTVAGEVYAGKCMMNSVGVSGAVYTGGVAGLCYESYTVNGCRAVVNVYGPMDDNVSEGVTYATGGMFGRISKFQAETPDQIGNVIANGTYLTGPSEYIGNFAGMVPDGETWDDNYQGRAIIVAKHGNVTKYIGNEQ